MILVDSIPHYIWPPPAIVRTVGFSNDAQFIESKAQNSFKDLRKAYSLDDGRMRVQEALVDQFDNCSQHGWDGYGAEPVRQETYNNAYRFIEALPHGFPMPGIGAEADGHLTLEWYRNPSRVVSVSVSPDGDLHYAALLGRTSRFNGTEPFLGDVPANLLQVIRRVVSA